MNYLKYSKIIIITLSVFLSSMIMPAYAIKIGLLTNVKRANIGASKKAVVVDLNTGKSLLYLTPMKSYKVATYKETLTIKVDKENYRLNSNKIAVRQLQDGFVYSKSKWYRGDLIVQKNGNRLTIINNVRLENYLLGVVPAEMPSSWNIEAQKAQAIAARSYAIANRGKRDKYGYDLKDTPEDQAYAGALKETVKTNKAVLDTKGLVLTCNNKIISAYYHSSAGGRTRTAKAVWNMYAPYTKSVNSYDNGRKKNGHGVGMSQYGANALANHGYTATQILNYFYNNVRLFRVNSNI